MERFLPKSDIVTVIRVDENDGSPMVSIRWVDDEGEYWPFIVVNFIKLAGVYSFKSSPTSDSLIRLYVMAVIYHETRKDIMEYNPDILDTGDEKRLWLRNIRIIQKDPLLYLDYLGEAVESLLNSAVDSNNADEWFKFLLDETLGFLSVKKNIIESQRDWKCFMCGKPLREEVGKEPERFVGLIKRVGDDPLASQIIFCSPSCRDFYSELKGIFK